jgi:carbon storage regulator CsrA
VALRHGLTSSGRGAVSSQEFRMFLLNRQQGQSIVIGTNLLLTITQVEARRAKLRISHTVTGGRISFDDIVEDIWVSPNDTICLGPDLMCTVVKLQDRAVRLDLDVPRNVAIHRKEIYDTIRWGN